MECNLGKWHRDAQVCACDGGRYLGEDLKQGALKRDCHLWNTWTGARLF